MKMNRQYRPKSWSQQARERTDMYIKRIEQGDYPYSEYIELIQNSYRAPIIKHRMAKHMGRYRRNVLEKRANHE